MTISSKRATTTNLSESELIRQFNELKSQCATIVITLGTPPDAKHQIPRVRKLAAKLGPTCRRSRGQTSNNPVPRRSAIPRFGIL